MFTIFTSIIIKRSPIGPTFNCFLVKMRFLWSQIVRAILVHIYGCMQDFMLLLLKMHILDSMRILLEIVFSKMKIFLNEASFAEEVVENDKKCRSAGIYEKKKRQKMFPQFLLLS